MTFTIITNINHIQEGDKYYAYGPYIREMNIWLKYEDEIIIVAPVTRKPKTRIDLAYDHPNIRFITVPPFNIKNPFEVIKTIFKLPVVLSGIWKGMRQSDHIHLRCPGNMGLLGALIQIGFPKKTKTAKYAGNWDWNSSQPLTYRLQQLLLRNTFLTRNMTALVYGEWPDRTKNILPFFTASYSEKDRLPVKKTPLTGRIELAFVGTLSRWKNPLTSLEAVRRLKERGVSVHLTYCGDGPQRKTIEKKTAKYGLENEVTLLGNVNSDKVKEILQQSHFLLFLSRSEGWPKAVAESMWWGCVPVTTRVSCVPQMLGNGERGFLLNNRPDEIAKVICEVIDQKYDFDSISRSAMEWSRLYTLERFEAEIRKLI